MQSHFMDSNITERAIVSRFHNKVNRLSKESYKQFP